jgi:acyl-CoA reductase-like NAD-dependent aldehyde dehydrogenase
MNHRMLINGEWVESHQILFPGARSSTEEIISEVPDADERDVDRQSKRSAP